MRFPAILLLPILLLATPSCYLGQATVDAPLDGQAIAQLEVGQSTANDVTRLLGAPNQVVELGTGSAWLYQAQNGKQMGIWLLIFGAFGQDTRSDRCWVFFNEAGILTHVGTTLEADQAEYHLAGS
jgi:outer membrane protein assembly factor BamE (lipoprotein component of BamABCDE complex)